VNRITDIFDLKISNNDQDERCIVGVFKEDPDRAVVLKTEEQCFYSVGDVIDLSYIDKNNTWKSVDSLEFLEVTYPFEKAFKGMLDGEVWKMGGVEYFNFMEDSRLYCVYGKPAVKYESTLLLSELMSMKWTKVK
jgi:hypothetical protein